MSASRVNRRIAIPPPSVSPQGEGFSSPQQDQEKLNQLVAELRLLEAYYEEVVARQQTMSAALVDSRSALESLDSISKTENSELLVPIGGGALISLSTPPVQKLIMSVGAGVAVEKSVESAKLYLQTRRQELERALTSLEQQRKEIGSRVEMGRATLQRMAAQG